MPSSESATAPVGVRLRAPALPLPAAALLAAASGGLAVLSFAPFHWWPLAVLAVLAFNGAVAGRDGRGAFLVGWAFGLGLFGFGVFWVRVSLNEFGNLPGPIANLLMVLFIGLLALFYGVAGWAIGTLAARTRARPWVGPLLALPGIWVLLEWLRGWLFTGFPWLILGTGQIDGPLAGLAPVVGAYGLGLAVVLSAGLIWCLLTLTGRGRLLALGALVVLWGLGPLLGRIDWTRPEGAPLRATLVQGNIEQSQKWTPDSLLPTLEVYLTLTHEALPTDLIVWPETAVPAFLHEVAGGLIAPMTELAREQGFAVVIGIPVLEPDGRYYNGLVAMPGTADGGDTPTVERYFKRHLVPFGEFLPLKDQLAGLIDWFDVPMSDFSAGAAARPLLRVGGHLVGASVCYEDVFPDEVRQALPDAAWLINVSNDAWFGDSLAPHQHLQFARARALENGRDLVRATNTGISAIIDHRGRVAGTIPSFQRGTLTLPIQPRTGATPFSRLGSGPVIALAALLLLAALALAWRSPGIGARPTDQR